MITQIWGPADECELIAYLNRLYPAWSRKISEDTLVGVQASIDGYLEVRRQTRLCAPDIKAVYRGHRIVVTYPHRCPFCGRAQHAVDGKIEAHGVASAAAPCIGSGKEPVML